MPRLRKEHPKDAEERVQVQPGHPAGSWQDPSAGVRRRQEMLFPC